MERGTQTRGTLEAREPSAGPEGLRSRDQRDGQGPGFSHAPAPGHGTEQPRGSRQCCCLLLKSHGTIGGPVADSAGQAEPGVPVTSYSEEPGAAAGRSHARPPRSHNLTLRATTRPLPPPPRRSHVVQAGNGDPAHCGLGAIDRDADPHPARRVRPHSCPRHARAMSRHRPRREVPARPRALTVSASRPPESRLSHRSGGTSSPSERKIAAEAGAGQERCWTSRWIPTTAQRAVRPR